MKRWGILILAAFVGARTGRAEPAIPAAKLEALYSEMEPVYLDIHRHPELSLHETRTASILAGDLRKLGFEVTEHVGGTGVVGVLRNGPGKTAMLRTELDALPLEEKTGLPYASRERTKDDSGRDVGVMHACGHDVHMAAWLGTATFLSRERSRWTGTLVVIAQPAEERGIGARAMLDDGLFTRFPKPDAVIALHDIPTLPSGSVGYTSGPALSSADSVDLTIFGKGAHGAHPEASVDPIVIAARTVLALQTLVSRENDPLDPAIVTVGSIHGGTKHNIIPDEVRLQLTVRAFREEVRQRLLAGIARIAKAEAEAAAAPKPPEVKIVDVSSNVTVNDPALTERVAAALRRELGNEKVSALPPETASEDFSEFGRAGVPSVIYRLGAAEPAAWESARREGRRLPSLHSALFAPDRKATITTGIRSEVAVLLDLLEK
ncbi:MAG TPA: amidohydrolase [Thermoanaerobaculia bacterium]|nr:amidohydrolase [Thermoanaerobaculia bacterium]